MKPEDLVPMGHGLAGLSHELRNVFAILGESVGLVEDLVAAGSPAGADERCARAFDRVGRQLERADRLARSLSLFAHTFDDATSPQPLSHLVDQARFLVECRARTAEIDIRVDLDEDPQVARPAELLLRLASVLGAAVAAGPAGSSLRVEGGDGEVRILAEPEGDPVASLDLP
jgi:signal transduction histidine kinase